jgi:ribosomal protein L32E
MEFLLPVPAARMLGGKRSSRLFQNVQFHRFRAAQVKRLSKSWRHLSRRKDEMVRTVKLYQKAELESMGKQENTIFG